MTASTNAGVVVSNWPTYHADAIANGEAPAAIDLSPATHAWTSRVLDGQIYGEPLVQNGRVVVATENDTVYTLNARTGDVLWADHVGVPVSSSALPCGDISPVVGITSTPAVDPARDEVFVVADEVAGHGAAHHLIGLSLSTGAVELNQTIDPPGSQPLNQLQRASLALADGEVIVGFGGNDGDCAYYHGWVAGVPEGGGNSHYFAVDSLPGDDQGAIWMGGASPVVDSNGNIWVAAGNGSQTDSHAQYDNSDSVLELSATMRLEQVFAPSTWASDNATDLDLGSSSPALLTDGLAVQVGKSGTAYLLRQSHLGGVGGQLVKASVCSGESLGGDATSGGDVFVPCTSGVTELAVGSSPPSLHTRWTFPISSGPPIIAGGLLWTEAQSGKLFGLDPASGHAKVELGGAGGTANHFPTPTAADGLLLAASASQVIAYRGPKGLPPGPTTTGTQHGYRLAASDGGVFDFGGAPFRGSMGGRHLKASVVGMASTHDQAGYWLVGSDGGVFAFGDAHYKGSMGGRHLNAPIVGIAATPDGGGYWLVAADGGIFAFGDAHFKGSMGGRHLNARIVGMTSDPRSLGYWLVGSDSGIFAFDAPFAGSLSGLGLNAPIVGIAATPTGLGYWIAARDGGVFTFGDAAFSGSMGSRRLVAPIVGMSPLVP
jgi:outer membrane protein assembly factor BamB